MTAYVPVIVALVGLILWAVFAGKPSSGILPETGRITFFVGLFWSVYPFAGKMLKLLTVLVVVGVALPSCGFCQQAANHDTARCKAERVTVDCGAPEVAKLVLDIAGQVAQALASDNFSSLLDGIVSGLEHRGIADAWGLVTCALHQSTSAVKAKASPKQALIYAHVQAWMAAHPAKVKGAP